MAVIASAPYEATITIYDGEGHTSTVGLWFDGGATIGEIQTYMEAFVPLLTPLVTGKVRDVKVSRHINQFTAGNAQGDVENQARFVWTATGTLKTMSMLIPTFEPTLIPDDDDKVDLTQVDVVAFVNAVKNGLGTPAVRPRDSETRTILGVKTATEAYGKKRRG
jgi:hypothetical protein